MSATFRLGLTGGIGSGKSSVAYIFSKLGATVIDADAISRTCTGPRGAAIAAIRANFGEGFVNVEGALDRGQMRKLVFADANARSCLEAIVHPLVRLEISRQLMLAQHNGARCLVFDIPLLVESSHWRRQFNRIMVVDCSTPTQIKRVQLRNGMPESDVEKIIASQATRLQRTASADYVLHNDDINLTQLREEVQKVAYRFGL